MKGTRVTSHSWTDVALGHRTLTVLDGVSLGLVLYESSDHAIVTP